MNKFLLLVLFTVLGFSSFAQNLKVTDPIEIASIEGTHLMAPKYSPDGKYIAFTSEKYLGLWIKNLEDGTINQLTAESAGFGYSWDASSSNILAKVAKFEDVNRSDAIFLFSIDKSVKQLSDYKYSFPGIPSFDAANQNAVMYSEGKLLKYSTGIKTLNKINAKASSVYAKENAIAVETLDNLEKISVNFNQPLLNVTSTLDKSKIAFEVYGGNMYVVNADGTNLVDLGQGYHPQLSADGNKIVYVISTDDGHEFTSSDVYVINTDGSQKQNVTNSNNMLEMNASFSPDGKAIVFDNLNDGKIYQINIAE